jgi:signal transduction histidine kinase
VVKEQIDLAPLQIGEMLIGSLHHAWMINDSAMVNQIVADVAKMPNIEHVQIVTLDGSTKSDLRSGTIDPKTEESVGCIACHQFPSETRPQAVKFPKHGNPNMRIAQPIPNNAECQTCHEAENTHLGMILIDLALVDYDSILHIDLSVMVLGTITLLVSLYFLINRYVVQRIELFQEPLKNFAVGDFSSRIPMPNTISDEFSELAATFNGMMEQLEEQIDEKSRRQMLRQQAIADERNRIARELHDGLAQILTYINTKATAVRLMIRNGKTESAEKYLHHLEKASQGLLAEVRQTILGLKVTSQIDLNLDESLKVFTDQFHRLNGLPVDLDISADVKNFHWDVDTKIELSRIAQEALSNIHKHAAATKVQILVQFENGDLVMRAHDNGNGFNPESAKTTGKLSFGISSMEERARAIGATLVIQSKIGKGTELIVKVPHNGKTH